MSTITSSFMARSIDPNKVAEILRECADKYIIPRFGTLADDEVFTKSGPNDLVTVADQETEAALEQILPTLISGSVVVGEEGVSAGRVDVGLLNDPSQTIWVVDPVDGTYNFRHGHKEFGMLIALVTGGEVIKSWIYDIPQDRIFIAEKGAGTFLDGQKQQVAQDRALNEVTGFVYAERLFPSLADFKKDIKEIKSLRCSAHEYIQIIEGKADFSVSNHSKSWDHLAAALAVREAGGVSKMWTGTDYGPASHGKKLIAASDDTLWQTVYNRMVRDVHLKQAPKP